MQTKIANIFYKLESSEINEKKLIDNINYAIAHRHSFSMKGLQSTFVMLTNKANRMYAEFLIKNVYLPDEYFSIVRFHEKVAQEQEESRVKAIAPASLDLNVLFDRQSSAPPSRDT